MIARAGLFTTVGELLAAEEADAKRSARWLRAGAAALMALGFWAGGLDAAGAEFAHRLGLVREDVLSPWLRALLLGGALAGSVATLLWYAYFGGVKNTLPALVCALGPLVLGALLGRFLGPPARHGKSV